MNKKLDTAAVLPGFSTARTPAKLDTTGLTGKDRILMLAEIIKAHEAGREVQVRREGYPGRLGPVTGGWIDHPCPGFGSDQVKYRIKPVSRTVYVNLYLHAEPELGYDDGHWWTKYDTAEEATRAAIGGAFAVAVPVTIEE